MNTTPNINLSTYTSDPNDKFNLLVTFNNNMSKIDTAVGAQYNAIEVIGATAGTAVTTANTASATAEEALNTAETKTSINDNVASNTTTYSSNKIKQLVEEAGGAVIDDSTTSLDSTWSSSKINNEINNKASINDTTASNTTTYSSNKIEELLSYNNYSLIYDTETAESNEYNYEHDITINIDGFYIIQSFVNAIVTNTTTSDPGKLFTIGASEINLKRNNTTIATIGDGYELSSLDFTNVTEPARYVNGRKNIIFKNNATVFLKSGDIINIHNYQAGSELWGTWKFTSKVKIIRMY